MLIEKVAIYARFSSDNQRTESIDAQIRAMKGYCQQQHWQIVATYIDEARSATTDNRPDFQRMIEDSAKGLFNIVLVHKLDRFCRNRYDSAIYKRQLKRNHVKIASVLERIDDSPESIMMESVLEGMAEYYSKNLSRETKKGLKENALKAIHNGGCCPLGYCLNTERKLEIEPNEAEAVRLIFEMFDSGYGYTAIINRLNELGHKTKKGCRFGKNSLYDILRNEKYCGVFVYNRSAERTLDNTRNNHRNKPDSEVIRIENGCPAIVSKELFERVQKRMDANRRNTGQYHGKEFYLLTGKVFCGICGKRMQGNLRFSGRNKTRLATYRCNTHRAECRNKEVNKDYLDVYIVDLLRQKIFNAKALRKLVAEINKYISSYNKEYDIHYDSVKAKFDGILESLDNITKAIERGMITDSIVQRAEELEQQRTEVESELLSLHKYIPVEYSDFAPLIDEFKGLKRGTETFRTFIQRYINKVIVYPYHLEIELNTGLCMADEVNEIVTIKRGELYEMFESRTRG